MRIGTKVASWDEPMKKTRGRRGGYAKAKRVGYGFEKEIDESLWYMRTHGRRMFHIKLPDTHSFDGMLKAAKNMDLAKRNALRYVTPKVPSDFLVIVDGKSVFIECKASSSHGIDLWCGDTIKPHQDTFAMDIENEGHGRYLYLFYSKREERVYALTFKGRLEAAIWQQDRNYGTVKWDEMIPFSHVVIPRNPRGSVVKWSLSELF